MLGSFEIKSVAKSFRTIEMTEMEWNPGK